MKVGLIFFVCLLAFSGCETIRGVSSNRESFPLIADKSCVIDAIKSVKDVRILDSSTKDEESKSWKGEPIHGKISHFLYEISDLAHLKISSQPGKMPISQIIIIERTSNDPRYNTVSCGNLFGHINGSDYRIQDKEQARRIIKKIDEAVVSYCKVDGGIPEPKFE